MAHAFDPVEFSVAFEMELNGSGSGWTDISRDVRVSQTPRWGYGTRGNGPIDLVAGTGTLSLALDNSANNSAKQVGFYSPDSVFLRSGVDLNVGLRICLHYGGAVTYKKYYVTTMRPTTGINGAREVEVLAVDWMDHAARHKPSSLAVQTNQRSDEIFTTLTDDVTQQPANRDTDTGEDIYPFALDNIAQDKMTVKGLYQQLAQSGFTRIFAKRDATDGETVCFQNRNTRISLTSNTATLDGDMSDMGVERGRDRIINTVEIETPLRRTDAAATTVLASIEDERYVIPAGQSLTIFLDYRDPDNEGEIVSGVEMVDPVEDTDYTMNKAEAGDSTDLTSDHTVVATFASTRVKLVISNTGSDNAFLTKMQCRGKGLYNFGQARVQSTDATSQTAYGERPVSIRMPWLSNANAAQAAADFIKSERKDPMSNVSTVSFFANRNHFLADLAMTLDVGDRIGIREQVSGVDPTEPATDNESGFWINAIDYEWVDKTALYVTLHLEPSSVFPMFFVLDVSVLDGTDVLGYF